MNYNINMIVRPDGSVDMQVTVNGVPLTEVEARDLNDALRTAGKALNQHNFVQQDKPVAALAA
jgi:hypothetical protein